MIDSLVFNNLQPRSTPSRQKTANSRPFVFNHLRTFTSISEGLLSLSFTRAKIKPFIFNRLRTLCSKHQGVPQLFFTPKAFSEGPKRTRRRALVAAATWRA